MKIKLQAKWYIDPGFLIKEIVAPRPVTIMDYSMLQSSGALQPWWCPTCNRTWPPYGPPIQSGKPVCSVCAELTLLQRKKLS